MNNDRRAGIDESCIDCGLCVEIAPALFASDPQVERAVVRRPPAGAGERALWEEAMEICPVEAIHRWADGPAARPGRNP